MEYEIRYIYIYNIYIDSGPENGPAPSRDYIVYIGTQKCGSSSMIVYR